MEIESRRIEARIEEKVCQEKVLLPWLDPSYLAVKFRETFRNISSLRKDFILASKIMRKYTNE